MGRSPCCPKEGVLKKGAWTPEEDQKLIDYIKEHGHGNWRALPKKCGLQRCGKSCRLRWTNYLRPDIKRGAFSAAEEQKIIQLHALVGNKWAFIASQLPKRTDNEIKNYWNTVLKKRTQAKNSMMNMAPEEEAAKKEEVKNGDWGGNLVQQKMMMMMIMRKAEEGSRGEEGNGYGYGGEDEEMGNSKWEYERRRWRSGGEVEKRSSGSSTSSNNSRSRSCNNHLAQWESARLEAEARLAERSSKSSGGGGAAIDWLFRGGAAAAGKSSTCSSAAAAPTAPPTFPSSPLPIEFPDHFHSALSLNSIPNLHHLISSTCRTSSLLLANHHHHHSLHNFDVPAVLAAAAADYRRMFHASSITSTNSHSHFSDLPNSAVADGTTDSQDPAAAGLIVFQKSNHSSGSGNAQTSRSSCCSHDQMLSTGFSAAAAARDEQDQDLSMSMSSTHAMASFKKKTAAAASAIKLGANGRLTWNRHELSLPNLITNPPPSILDFLQHSATPAAAAAEDSSIPAAAAAAAFDVNSGIMNRVPTTKLPEPAPAPEVGDTAAAASSAASLLSLAAVESILSSFSGIDDEVDAAGTKSADRAVDDRSDVGIESCSHDDENSGSGSNSFNMSSMLQDFYSSLQHQLPESTTTTTAKGLMATDGEMLIRSSSNSNANCNMIGNNYSQSAIDDICNLLQQHVASANSKSSSPANAHDAGLQDSTLHNFFLLSNQQIGGAPASSGEGTSTFNNNYVTQALNFQQLDSLLGEASEAQFNNLLMDLNLC